MKKILLLSGLFLMGFSAVAQFTKNRLVVSQYGDESAIVAGKTVPIILKEFKTTLDNAPIENAPTYTLPMPIVAGTNNNFPISGLYSSAFEGLLTLSQNGLLITTAGYGLAPGSTSPATADIRVISTIDANGTIITNTNVKGSGNNLINPRCMFTLDGSFFWTAADAGGTRYRPAGYVLDMQTAAVATTPAAMRSITVFNGKLYGSSTATGPKIFSIANGTNTLPITGATATQLPGLSAVAPNQLLFFRMAAGVGDPDLLYFTNDGAKTIEKWIYNSVAVSWEKKGEVVITGDAPKGITGQLDKVLNKAFVYVTSATKLLSFEDSDYGNSSLAANVVTTIATAPTNTIFRGVTLTPNSPTTLPIKLTSFIGNQVQQTVKLSWITASETNNAKFEIWKSLDGKSFNKLGTVDGNNTTNQNNSYTLIDRNPANGMNYYELKQIDNDGNSETFKTIPVKVSLSNPKISAYFSNDQLEVNLFAANAGQARIVLSNISGRKIIDTKVNVAPGYSISKTPIADLQSGVYVVTVTIDGINHSLKLIK